MAEEARKKAEREGKVVPKEESSPKKDGEGEDTEEKKDEQDKGALPNPGNGG